MLVVPAIFGTVALPAYALMPGGPSHGASGTFSLSNARRRTSTSRRSRPAHRCRAMRYAVTTKAEIEEARLEAEAAERASWGGRTRIPRPGSYAVYTVRAEGDDYPWRNETARRLRRRPPAAPLLLPRVRRLRRLAAQPRRGRHERAVEVGLVEPRLGQRLRVGRRVGNHGWPTRAVTRPRRGRWFPYNHVAYVQSINADGTVTSRSTTRTPTIRTTGAPSRPAGAVPLPAGLSGSRRSLSTSWRNPLPFVGRVDQCVRRDRSLT